MRSTYFILVLLSLIAIQNADLRSDVQDFINLLPKSRVAFLTGRHFLFDAKFRAAFNYLRSPSFEVLVRDDISKNQNVQDIIDYLDRDIDLTAISRFIKRVIIRLRPPQEYVRVRTLGSFISELADMLPDDKISNLIREKSSTDPEFAKLNAKVSDPQFKTLVYKARNAESLAGAFKTLISNQVDVDLILQIGFQKIEKWTQPIQ